ncbi:peptidase S41 [Oleiphilus sp. HI0130]|nr:peptidase S41 [Oleiphilus sp. HI0079]KZZ48385.1 peptidase S41 [Oleiphilus sp. HI0118]KZZ63829.1 peptidase S41 [Oleiphilus sp. HI0130]
MSEKSEVMKFIHVLVVAISLLSFGSVHAAQESLDDLLAQAQSTPELSPEKSQREASVHIARSLLLSHYRKQDIDRTLSERVFDHYLDSLDSQRLYFLQSDIEEFAPYRTRLHGALKTGQLEPGFKMYNRYQERVIKRAVYKIELLKNDLKDMDFENDEFILSDRSELPWATTEDELRDIWRKRVKSAALSLKLSGKSLEEAAKTLRTRYQSQLKRALQTRSEDAFQAYMNAFTTLYDPHTNYFSPRLSENFNINMSLSLEGIGAVLQADNEFTKVVRLIAGGPAQQQGQLGPADRIVGVAQGEDGDMVDVVGWRLDEVVELIRGPKHSTVRLEVIPSEAKVDTETRQIAIVRDKVKLEDQAAKSKLIETQRNGVKKRVGVIAIPTFYADFQAMQTGDPNYKSTTRDTLNLLNEMRADGELDGLVIDLRGNGGGSLDEANRLTGLFIEEGPTVQIRSANDRVEVLTDPDPELVYGGPLVVLVDRLSASASEIFAGAIQDYDRGLVMGSQTFGKGTVQSVRPLNHGQLKITQAKFYRISGASTQHKGVVPDIEIPDIVDRTKVGEDALENALPWDSIAAADYSVVQNNAGIESLLNERHKKRLAQNEDFKVLLEEIALLEKQRNQAQVSLKRTTREKEIQEAEKEQLSLENRRRALDGKEPYANYEAWEEDVEKQASETRSDELEIDFIVDESVEVLLDYIEATAQASIAKAS